MKDIKRFLKKFDIFGINFTFRYKDKEAYQTVIGGFFSILFLIAALFMGIYYFIPFVNRKNYTIVYYTMNLASTEEVSLFASESNFAFGLSCENNDKETKKIEDLLYIQSKYVYYIKNMNGSFHKDPRELKTNKCTYEDFYNKYDSQFDYLTLSNLECMENKDISVQGIYADQIFSYFEFTVLSKNDSKELIDEIETFLLNNDCKLSFVYTDIIIDLDNYEKPIDQYLNEMFIQLNPTLFIKKNVYFMNQDFSNDNFLMFVIGDGDTPETKPLYSRYEEYALYKGLNRSSTQLYEYNHYSKMYIRADIKKVIIKRKYQKFLEFYADASSLLVAIYEVFVIIFNYINIFYGHHSVSKRIFFFKEMENTKHFNIFKRTQTIKQLIAKTDTQSANPENNVQKIESIENKNLNIVSLKKRKKINQRSRIKENEIKIYNNKKKVKNKEQSNNIYNMKGKNNEDIKLYNISSDKRILNEKYMEDNKNEYSQNIPNIEVNQISRNKNRDAILNFKSKDKKDSELVESLGAKIEKTSPGIEKAKEDKKEKTEIIENSFNIFEIIITQFLKCFMCKDMKIKNEINEKANIIMFQKTDIITYIRNMLLFDLINQITLNNNKKEIINFLCRPIISVNKEVKNKFSEFYNYYNEKSFNKYIENIQELIEQPKKEDKEIELISTSNNHFKDFL